MSAMSKAEASLSEEDRRAVDDHPEWTDEDLRNAKPLAAFAPELAKAIQRGRGKQKTPTKVQINLRLDPRIIEHFKSGGPGWQVRMGEALRKAANIDH